MTASPSLVFVVGAGASKAMSPNMPVGTELAERIATALAEEFGGDQPAMSGPISQALEKMQNGLNDNRIRAANQIRYAIARKDSIDDLLDEWSDQKEMLEVAKIAITHVILKSEVESHLARKSTNDDAFLSTIGELHRTWLARIARHVGPRLPRRALAQALQDVGFVIFNYDRYVEQMLFGELRCQGMEKSAAYYAVEHLPIVHVYGSVCPFGATAVAPFGKESLFLMPLYQGIRTYTERSYNGPELAKMRDMLAGAKRTVFLGFGFHPTNMTHLTSYGLNMQGQFYGACPHSNPGRFEAAKRLLYAGPLEAQTKNLTEMDCAQFIESYRAELFGT
ncbi:MAG: hypothetical protein KJS68_09455 [Alphaproteobacteria bacterium]|nr:hypothetical protein [Alphaproteobacteria bacterium]MDE2134997.1 hypothetical protein [Alphaproteobacteria bacterium]